MPVKAEYRSARVSPRKAALVASLVRGRSVNDAITILEHTPRRAAVTIKKVIVSARANAVHDHNYKPDSLYISQITVGAGLRLKRYRPAARGRALPYQHKTSHIKVLVDGEKRVVKKPSSEHTKKVK
ncbi:50S ribosomal protein L22 [Candidatus Saccharibacteria bacterium RIFCSPHIGHO2_12_FULL_47_16b]|nr:MAG: 50S ribosomal protein L22 [Candidatus Saccharibacteria bacterium RIFCSPHIGHO2_12_FULL_47_16b]